jgi:hypothetical protein
MPWTMVACCSRLNGRFAAGRTSSAPGTHGTLTAIRPIVPILARTGIGLRRSRVRNWSEARPSVAG